MVFIRRIETLTVTCLSLLLLYWFFTLDYVPIRKPLEDNEIPLIETFWGVVGKEEIEQTIFRPSGFWIRENDIIPRAEYLDLPNCTLVMAEWLSRNQGYNYKSMLPTIIPKGVMNMFTKNGLIALVEELDNTKFDKRMIIWKEDRIKEFIRQKVEVFEESGGQQSSLTQSMKSFGINGKYGLIFGSSKDPWIEALALHEGAYKLVKTGPINFTIEDYRYVKYLNPFEMVFHYHSHINTFDFAITFSVQNMGFGKVDPLNPNGDLLEIQKTYCMLKDGGLLFLGIPIGWDTMIWNSLRVYGRIRLAMIAWDILAMFHDGNEIKIDAELFEKPSKAGVHKWVVMVLRKRHSTTEWF